jgi:hypothetical protein
VKNERKILEPCGGWDRHQVTWLLDRIIISTHLSSDGNPQKKETQKKETQQWRQDTDHGVRSRFDSSCHEMKEIILPELPLEIDLHD